MLYIYVKKITDRCLYTCDFMLGNQGIPYRLTDNAIFFEQLRAKKLNYSEEIFVGVEQLLPANLLFESQITPQILTASHFLDEPCLAFDGRVDPLAAVFFVLSRMEEYIVTERDHHKRFEAKNSILFQFNWHEKLVCDRWTKQLVNFLYEKQLVEKKYQALQLSLQPTFDIDNTYAYLQKGGFRQIISTFRNLLRLDKKRLRERPAVLSGKIKDPFDTFVDIQQIAKEHPVHLFWLLGNYARYDTNISHSDLRHRSLIRKMAKKCRVSIHPSYLSNALPGRVKEEVNRLSDILQIPIKHSRQHFLKLDIPTTYHRLLHVGITDDYTMGYASHAGFRAGTLQAFKWFDLSKNQLTELTIHSFAYMDGTLLEYQKMSPHQAQQKIQALYDEARLFGGDFYFIWHNSTIGEYGIWKGWRKVLDFTLNLHS